MPQASSTTQQAFYGRSAKKYDNKKREIVCDECGKTGHKTSRCFKLRNKIRNKEQKEVYAKNAFSAVLFRDALKVSNAAANQYVFYLDSGASQNMTPYFDWLTNVRPTPTTKIRVANNEHLSVKCIGDMSIEIDGANIEMKNVLCVPNLATNLISVSKLTENGNKIEFDKNGCSIFNPRKEQIARAKLMDGVYQLKVNVPML